MSKEKTNALDALRALIAERQQYDQWISTLEAKRPGTPEHVFERVYNDYRGRLDRVVGEIRGYAEELQLSISTLSARLVEVARDEDTRREGLQEAELRAAVGEYEPAQWEEIRSEAESALEKIAADRVSLDSQLSELRAIQKLSEISPAGVPAETVTTSAASVAGDKPVETRSPSVEPPARAQERQPSAPRAESGNAAAGTERSGSPPAPPRAGVDTAAPASAPASSSVPLEPVAAAAGAAARPRSMKSPVGGIQAVRARSEGSRPDSMKTLKCPECGTANYPTEWYCERCGGELATM